MLTFCIGIDTVSVDIDIFKISDDHNLTIINLQQLHRYLREATYHLTSYYNPQLLCWITCLLIDIITLVFANVYKTNQHDSVLMESSLYMLLLFLIFQIIAISRICHLTCNQVFIYYMRNKIDIAACVMLHKIVLGERVSGYNILGRGFHI